MITPDICTNLRRAASALLVAAFGILAVPLARADDILVSSLDGNRIAQFDAATGTLKNANFIATGLDRPAGIAVDGDRLYVANFNGGTVGVYNARTGAVINATLISGLGIPIYVKIHDGKLYVGNIGLMTDRVGVYDPMTGAAIDADLMTGLDTPRGIAFFGDSLLLANSGVPEVGVYNATTGATVNASLITDATTPLDIAIHDNVIYLSNGNVGGTVRTYTLFGGLINANLTGAATLTNPAGLLIDHGFLYVTSTNDHRVAKFRLDGTVVNESFLTGVTQPFGLALVPALPTPVPPPATPTVKIDGAKRVTTTKSNLTLKGTATAASRVTVKVGKTKPKTAKLAASGKWTFRAKLLPGRNVAVATAINAEGKTSQTAKVTISRE